MQKRVLIFLLFISVSTQAQLTYQHLAVDYDTGWTFRNLRVIPVRMKDLPAQSMPNRTANTVSFSQALASGIITVEERGTAAVENVHWLSLYNNSDKNVFISSGEVLAGGRQDRIVTKDTVVLARTGRIDLPVMCVEEGRWSEKTRKFQYQKSANLHLRKTLDLSHNQVLVWKEINNQLERDKVKNKTNSYLARQTDKKFTIEQNEYWNFFQNKFRNSDSSIVGVICVSGDKVIGSDIFLGSNIFYGQLRGLMLGYIEEAIVFGATPAMNDSEVRSYANNFLNDEPSQERFAKKNGKQFKNGGQTWHLTIY